jgi:citrate synthase
VRTTLASEIKTSIATHDVANIWLRGRHLTGDVMGHMSFAEVAFLLIVGRPAEEREGRLVDAVLVALMEHGLTPSAMVSRVTHAVAPESLQGAVAAGLLGVGNVVLGSMEECGSLLTRIDKEVRSGVSRRTAIDAVIDEYQARGARLPGIGHAIHTDGDPRAPRLFQIARECGFDGSHIETIQELAAAVTERGRRLPVNVTGAVAAVLLELGVAWRLHRGFALIARCAGLVAHLEEEDREPITPALRAILRSEGQPR